MLREEESFEEEEKAEPEYVLPKDDETEEEQPNYKDDKFIEEAEEELVVMDKGCEEVFSPVSEREPLNSQDAGPPQHEDENPATTPIPEEE